MGLLWTTVNHTTNSSPAYPQTVINHNAPTADQARLLHDLESEAQNRIVQKASINNSLVNANILVFEERCRRGFLVQVAFSLNGTDLSFSYEVEDDRWISDPRELVENVYKRISDEIAGHLLGKPEVRKLMESQ